MSYNGRGVDLCICESISCVSSCAEPGGLSERRLSDRAYTGTVSDPCACGSDVSAHPSGQISSCSPPMNSGKAFHLIKDNKADSSFLKKHHLNHELRSVVSVVGYLCGCGGEP